MNKQEAVKQIKEFEKKIEELKEVVNSWDEEVEKKVTYMCTSQWDIEKDKPNLFREDILSDEEIIAEDGSLIVTKRNECIFVYYKDTKEESK